MLGYFPTPYPDELLYSLLARYHVHSGNVSYKNTIEELFGYRTIRASIHFQSNLNKIVERLPSLCKITADFLIENHTNFPVYRPFLTPERAIKVELAQKEKMGEALYNLIGINASSIKTEPTLKYCPSCYNGEITKYGEGYWHRIHQLSGVLVCPHHQIILRKGSFNISEKNEQEFIPISKSVISEEPIVDFFDLELVGISQDIYWLSTNKLSPRQLNYYRDKYIDILKKLGLAHSSGRVKQVELQHKFVAKYGKDTLRSLNADIKVGSIKQTWLSLILQKNNKFFNPLYHVLLMRFLTGSAKEFFNTNFEYLPFGRGPWHCLNPVCKNFGQKVITELKISHCYDSKKVVGTFSCCCGFVYSRRGPDVTYQDKFKIGKVIKYGFIWEETLEEYINEGLTLKDIAKQLNVDRATVKKIAAELELKVNWKPPIKTVVKESGHNNKESIKSAHRNNWLNLINENKYMGITEIRMLIPNVYTWLYRHDRNWLQANSPKKTTVSQQNLGRVNWENRDKELLLEIKLLIKNWNDKDKPIRKTRKLIAKKLNKVGWVENNRDKIPLSLEFMSIVCESVEEFQVRRVIWAIDKLKEEKLLIKTWQVLRKARIKGIPHESVLKTIESKIYAQ